MKSNSILKKPGSKFSNMKEELPMKRPENSSMKSKHKKERELEDGTEKQSRKLNFRMADSIEDIKKTEKRIRKMSFAERLELESSSRSTALDVQRSGCGQRQVSYTVRDQSSERFKLRREKQLAHLKERRGLIRSTNKLKGRRKLDKM